MKIIETLHTFNFCIEMAGNQMAATVESAWFSPMQIVKSQPPEDVDDDWLL